ncbi:tetratricopeptide repeat protein [Kutzneria sp. 744]|uniref:tetratricopeptide repeat protein n=1 Tax=Kutzneria sp. (strain 744) TaxID=345341 RepID=UPI0003EEBAEF|nr:tetratricopeptide repeat protein [Kutzneria sp. 744]EWM09796.1 LigA protein [Kutzneria sp. 744]
MADASTERSGAEEEHGLGRTEGADPGPNTVDNRISGGKQHNVLMTGAVRDVHFHGGGDLPSDLEDPVIATVRLRPGGTLADLVVDADPPRVMVPSGTVHVITLEARTKRAVVLDAAEPVIVSRRLPRPACLLVRVGATIQPRRFTTDFDERPPQMRALGADFPFSISTSEVEQFWFEPIARTHEISWHLKLHWTCAGRSGTTVIDNNGKPFEVYPVAALYNGREPSVLDSGCGLMHARGCPSGLLKESGLPTSLWDSTSSPLPPYSALAALGDSSAADATGSPSDAQDDAPEDLKRRILDAGLSATDPEVPASWPEYRRVALLVRSLFARPDFHRSHEPEAFRALLIRVLRYLYLSGQCQPGAIIGRTIHPDWAEALGEDHLDTLAAANRLAGCLVGLGKSKEALELFADLAPRYERALGENHPQTLIVASNLGAALAGLGAFREAREQYEAVVQRSRQALGPDDPSTLRAASGLAAVLRRLGDLDAARAGAEDAVRRYRRTLGDEHLDTVVAVRTFVTILRSLGEDDLAQALEAELRPNS